MGEAETRQTVERLFQAIQERNVELFHAQFHEDSIIEQWQERTLNDDSRHRVYKRYLTGTQLTEELGGELLFEGRSFIAARVTWS